MKNLNTQEKGQIEELAAILKKKFGLGFNSDGRFEVRPVNTRSLFTGKFHPNAMLSLPTRVDNKEVEICLEKVGNIWFFGIVVSIYDTMRPQIQESRYWSPKLSLQTNDLGNVIFGAKNNFGTVADSCVEFGRILAAVQECRKANLKASQIIDQKV